MRFPGCVADRIVAPNASFHGPAILGSTFQGPLPNWIVDAERLRGAAERFAGMPTDSIPVVGSLPSGSFVPFAPNPNFVGRDDELRDIAVALRGSEPAALCPPAGLQGLGGVGKTQLAVEFAHRYGRFFEGGVYWLSCADPATIDGQVAQIGAAMPELPDGFVGLPQAEQCALVWRAWRSGLPRLLIFDNCEEDGVLARLLPKQGGARALVTSRRTAWSPGFGLRAVPVRTLPREASLRLLAAFRPDLAAALLEPVAEALGDLPLALHLAGHFLHEARFEPIGSPNAYLAEFERVGLLHDSLIGIVGASGVEDRSPTDHERHVADTFAVSWNRLDPRRPADEWARDLLGYLGLLAPRVPVPRDFCRRLGMSRPDAPERRTGDALKRLEQLGLVELGPNGEPILHELVCLFALHKQEDLNAPRSACGQALFLYLKGIVDLESIPNILSIVPHAQRFIANFEKDNRHLDFNEGWESSFYNNLATALTRIQETDDAVKFLNTALTIDEKYSDDRNLISIRLSNLADAYQRSGKLVEALTFAQRALGEEKIAGLSHKSRLLLRYAIVIQLLFNCDQRDAGMELLAEARQFADGFGEAFPEELSRFWLDLAKILFKHQNHEVAWNLVVRSRNSNLTLPSASRRDLEDQIFYCRLAQQSGHAQEADTVLSNILASIGNFPKSEDVSNWQIFGSVPVILHRAKEIDQAKKLFDRALDSIPEKQKYTVQAAELYLSLAVLKRDVGQWMEAKNLLLDTIAIDEKVYGPNSSDVAYDKIELGGLFYACGQISEALAQLAGALDIYKSILGVNHPRTRDLARDVMEIKRRVQLNHSPEPKN